MNTFIDISYPLINTKLPGLRDIKLTASIVLDTPIKIVEHGISKVSKKDDVITFDLYIKYQTSSGPETLLNFTAKTNTNETIPVTVSECFTGTINAYISFEDLLYKEQATVLPDNAGILEPCTLIVITQARTSISFALVTTSTTTVFDSFPQLADGFLVTTMSDGTYNIYGETPYEVLDIEKGVVSVNGLKGPDLKITVSDSFTITNDHDNHLIEITEK